MANRSSAKWAVFDPDWILDPPPEPIWERFQERIKDEQIVEIAKAQLEAKRVMLTAQRAVLDAQVKAMDAQIKVNDMVSKMVNGLR